LAKDSVLGSMAYVSVTTSSGPQSVGEVLKFSAKQEGDLKKKQPLGETKVHAQFVPQGWSLDWDGEKIDRELANLIASLEDNYHDGKPMPRFEFNQVIDHYDGTQEKYKFEDVTIYDYQFSQDKAAEAIKEQAKGFSPRRTAE